MKQTVTKESQEVGFVVTMDATIPVAGTEKLMLSTAMPQSGQLNITTSILERITAVLEEVNQSTLSSLSLLNNG